ncbi:hypothetical protein, partial [Rhodococcus aetherivorans]
MNDGASSGTPSNAVSTNSSRTGPWQLDTTTRRSLRVYRPHHRDQLEYVSFGQFLEAGQRSSELEK